MVKEIQHCISVENGPCFLSSNFTPPSNFSLCYFTIRQCKRPEILRPKAPVSPQDSVPLKGYFRFFEVRLSEVLIYSQCLTYSRWQSVCSQFGESAGVPAWKLSYVPLWTGPAVKTYFSRPKKGPPKNTSV